MARYVTTIESSLSPEEAYAYMANFSNAREWDPSVEEAVATGGDPGLGSTFDLVARFGSRKVPLRYETVSYEAPRLVVLESKKPRFISRDTITVAPATSGSTIHYDALLEFNGAARLVDPIMQLLFRRTGDKAAAGLRAALNP